MGADSVIFEKKSKRYYYFDRHYNFMHRSDDDRAQELYAKLEQEWNGRVPGEFGTINQAEVIELAKLNIEHWKTQGEDAGRVFWNKHIIEFAELHPDGEFFVVSDHHEPPYWDIRDRDKYTEWEPL